MDDGIRPQPGHTLVELLATLGVIAVLAASAAPSFAHWLLDIRRDSAVTASLHAVHVARQLAAVRGEAVSLCGTLDELRCSGLTDWSRGLLLATQSGRARRGLTVPAASSLRANRAEIRFEAGTGHASPATLSICDRRGAAAARTVIVSRSGRPRATAPGEGAPSC
ncbi:MAG TPA: GspH/FimT family pseudopilin [Steroidobacteraceae bacterium]|jgi:type IV fimbrial biogenesis protein FimT